MITLSDKATKLAF